MGNEAIILAGGLGTRLRTTVPGTPKCMAPVAGKPFLHYVIEFLIKKGTDKFIFSLGYMSEAIIAYLGEHYAALNIQYSIEEKPLGTGGAIKLALTKATEKNVLVLNGDTLFSIDLAKLSSFHFNNCADCTLSLKPMRNFDRYGAVELKRDRSISCFREKQYYEQGFINGGVYALNVASFLKEDLPEVFSFEKDYLEKYTGKRKFYGVVQDEYFIDIGIPEDYTRAQEELKEIPVIEQIDLIGTLFLDRDGVINYEKDNDYIHTWDEFRFYEGALEAIAIFAKLFKHIIVVTNQRGIAKGVTKPEDLATIHTNMTAEIEKAGGRIDAVYFCPDLDDSSPNRKPNPGMGLQALKDFPDIELNKAFMVGNTLSDMQFGRNLGIKTVFLPTTHPEVDLKDERIDEVYPSLLAIANNLKNLR